MLIVEDTGLIRLEDIIYLAFRPTKVLFICNII